MAEINRIILKGSTQKDAFLYLLNSPVRKTFNVWI